jgi:hypothetical protein
MEGALEFGEHGCESNSSKAKKPIFTTGLRPQRGTIFFGYFLCSHKENTSPQ